MKAEVLDPTTPTSHTDPMAPSPYWGEDPIWDSQTVTHNPMFDETGRVWYTSAPAAREQSRLVPGGLRPAVGEIFPCEGLRPPARDV